MALGTRKEAMPYDQEIERRVHVAYIIKIVFDPGGSARRPKINLGIAGDAWADTLAELVIRHLVTVKIGYARRLWAGTDDAHVTDENVPQLWEFSETRILKEPTKGCHSRMLSCVALHPRTQPKLLKDAPTLTHALLLHKDRTSHDPENCQGNQGNREQHQWSDGDDDENFAESLSLSINLVGVVRGSREILSILRRNLRFGNILGHLKDRPSISSHNRRCNFMKH
jgi:hypothetical protein